MAQTDPGQGVMVWQREGHRPSKQGHQEWLLEGFGVQCMVTRLSSFLPFVTWLLPLPNNLHDPASPTKGHFQIFQALLCPQAPSIHSWLNIIGRQDWDNRNGTGVLTGCTSDIPVIDHIRRTQGQKPQDHLSGYRKTIQQTLTTLHDKNTQTRNRISSTW